MSLGGMPLLGGGVVAPPAPSDPALLLEDGSYLLLEDGSKLLLE